MKPGLHLVLVREDETEVGVSMTFDAAARALPLDAALETLRPALAMIRQQENTRDVEAEAAQEVTE